MTKSPLVAISLFSLFAIPACAVHAEDATADPAPKAGDKIEKVTITSGRPAEMTERRQSTAAKLIFGREELDRAGDSTIADVLKRLPGVSIGGRPGRGGDIRMRGLGNGYTQILLNGERAPRGFSFDSLAPDQVERIEVIRGPVAEHSTQAIAGTINIILREGYKQDQTQLRISDASEQGRHGPNLSATVPGKLGALTYLLSGAVFQHHQVDHIEDDTLGFDANGQQILNQHILNDSTRRTHGMQLTPRLSYRFENGDTLVFQQFLMQSHGKINGNGYLSQLAGDAPYALANSTSSVDSSVARGFGNWQHRLDKRGKLELKFGFGTHHSENNSWRNQYDAAGNLLDNFYNNNIVRDNTVSLGAKYTTPMGDGHVLASGLEGEWGHRRQTQIALDNGQAQFADSGEDLAANTRRLAAFVQDEWDINPQWSTNLGLRWEGIRTTSDTGAGVPLANASGVWSPVLHGVWHIPGHDRDQVRASFTHSYRAPSLADLMALPALSRVNSATSPDRIGNPGLKPELATGLELAIEHYFSGGGILSANIFHRGIKDLMRRQTSLQTGAGVARWVSQPLNMGRAQTSGLELEAKFQVTEFFPDAPALDLRANYSRYWSNVGQVPGPNNRLDQQAKQSANLGIDYRLKALPLTLGGSVNWTPGYVIQTTEAQTSSSGVKRQVDLYALWKFNPATQLRLSANNLLANDALSGTSYTTNGALQSENLTARTYTTWTLKLEMKI